MKTPPVHSLICGFTILSLCLCANGDARADNESNSRRPPAFPTITMKRHILLIEDNAQNRYLVTYLLEQSGYEVVSAVSGPLGIELAGQVRPDLIALDIQLPVMDGYAVARALKGSPQLSSIPIVAVTSYDLVGDWEKAIAAGCDGYMEKPINPETFVAEIERFLHPQGKESVP